MDDRVKELKVLKKAYKRAKRRAITLWKLMAVFNFLACICCGLLGFFPVQVAQLAARLELAVSLPTGAIALTVLQIMTGVTGLVFAVALAMWIAGRRKVKRSDEFLSYRTLKEALWAEKKQP